DCGNLPAVFVDLDQGGRRVGIPVEDVVVGHLEIPLQLPVGCVESDNATRVEVVTRAATAVVLVGCIAQSNEDQTVGYVDGHGHPSAGSAAVLPALRPPASEARLAGTGHRVEAPDLFASVQIEGARIARDAVTALLTGSGNYDREILI